MSDYSELALYLIEHYNEASPEAAAGRALLELEARVAELNQYGFVLGMRLMQSDIFHQLDDTERTAIDAFVNRDAFRAALAKKEGE